MNGLAVQESKAVVPVPHGPARTAGRDNVVGQAVLFTVIGVLATAANAVLYVLLREVFPTGPSNLISLLITTVASSMAHRHFAFADRHEHPIRMHLQTLAVFLFYCVSNNIALGLLALVVENPSSVAEAVAVAAMSIFGGITRFVVLRIWVFSRSAAHRTNWK
ncbi:GtrA family protein [Saccharopolyspora phatthalungensis]|uniref:Putative flippase GtrA n=1 Tax=Saccharopolyspora phatthalungensis TaxID=664693 RepID=A0A840QDH1_9PSEU|nr:GtrA family protein [Saccharopolyspora phatthalungensis]MBB5157961.1 putative flippase GtrA [Saccharopolyspora phatthalungensis]